MFCIFLNAVDFAIAESSYQRMESSYTGVNTGCEIVNMWGLEVP